MEGFNVTNDTDECHYDVKEEDFTDDTKDNKRLEFDECEDLSLKVAAQILELINMESITSKVIDNTNPKVYVDRQVFLQKREEKLPKSSVVDEHKHEEQTPILSNNGPTSDLHVSRTERLLKCPTCTKSFSNQSAFTRHKKTHKKEKKLYLLRMYKSFPPRFPFEGP